MTDPSPSPGRARVDPAAGRRGRRRQGHPGRAPSRASSGVPHLASGNLFRAALDAGTPLGERGARVHGARRARPRRASTIDHVHGRAGQARGGARRHPRRLPAHGRRRRTALDETLAAQRGARRRASSTSTCRTRSSCRARGRPLGLPDLRHAVPRGSPIRRASRSLRPRRRRAQSARRRSARGRPRAARASRCRRCSRSSTTTSDAGVVAPASMACSRSTAVTAAILDRGRRRATGMTRMRSAGAVTIKRSTEIDRMRARGPDPGGHPRRASGRAATRE